jgi:tetratricopeptide (TPR) repeat protein
MSLTGVLRFAALCVSAHCALMGACPDPACLLTQVRTNLSQNDVDAVKSNLRELAARFPNDVEAHATLARILAEKNLFMLALAEALRAGPIATVELAALENTVGAYSDALGNALPAEKNSQLPNEIRASAAGVAGLSYESLGETEPAIEHLKTAIQLDPSRDNSYLALADLYERMQKYADAAGVLQQARLHIGDSPAILLPLGADLIRAEKYLDGVQILHTLLQRDPNVEQAYIGLADAARRMGNPDQEVEVLRGLERHNPRFPMLHVLIARAMLNKEHPGYPVILRELALAEKTAPADPDVFFLRGKVLLALGRQQEAVSALRRSIELRPMEPGPYYQLAKLYQKLGKTEMARAEFERVKSLEAAGSFSEKMNK